MRRLPAFLHLPEWQPPFLPTRPPWERKTRYWPHVRFLRQVRCNESQVINILDFEPAYPGLSPPQSTAGQVGKPLSESGQWTATLTVRHPAKSRTLPALPLLFYIQHKGQLNYPYHHSAAPLLWSRETLSIFHFPETIHTTALLIPDLSILMASVFLSFSSHVSFSSAMIFSDSCVKIPKAVLQFFPKFFT